MSVLETFIEDKAEFTQESIFFHTPIICLMNFINKQVGY